MSNFITLGFSFDFSCNLSCDWDDLTNAVCGRPWTLVASSFLPPNIYCERTGAYVGNNLAVSFCHAWISWSPTCVATSVF